MMQFLSAGHRDREKDTVEVTDTFAVPHTESENEVRFYLFSIDYYMNTISAIRRLVY